MPHDRFGSWYDSDPAPTTINPALLHCPPLHGTQPYQHDQGSNSYPTPTPAQILDRAFWASLEQRRNGQDRTHQRIANHAQYAAASLRAPGFNGKWDSSQLNAVPQAAGHKSDYSGIVVEFKSHPRHKLGSREGATSMVNILRYKDGAMECPLDTVLEGLGQDKIRFRLAWPGYHPEWLTLHTVAKDGRPITRYELGMQVSQAHVDFFKVADLRFLIQKVEMNGILPDQLGMFNIALHRGPHARPGSFGIKMEQLHLISVRDTGGGVWQADVEVV
ncbi:hypothetical protein BU15DRAFT_68735 [Melanogaster broomeanus]|nr:hypothetical protein BU15DRAFT_68735 [Melanogaster broomeanus]